MSEIEDFLQRESKYRDPEGSTARHLRSLLLKHDREKRSIIEGNLWESYKREALAKLDDCNKYAILHTIRDLVTNEAYGVHFREGERIGIEKRKRNKRLLICEKCGAGLEMVEK